MKFWKADLNITNNLLLRCDILTNFDSKTIKIRISTKETKYCLTSSKYCLSRHTNCFYIRITPIVISRWNLMSLSLKNVFVALLTIYTMSKCLQTKVLHHLLGICLHYIAPRPSLPKRSLATVYHRTSHFCFHTYYCFNRTLSIIENQIRNVTSQETIPHCLNACRMCYPLGQ